MLTSTLILSTLVCATPAPPTVKEAAVPPLVEAVCVDGSKVKVALLDEFILLSTKYGDLKVPSNSVKGIEFATRTNPAISEKIAQNVSKLGHPDFATREDCTNDLKKIGPRAYSACLQACKSTDPEVARRAGEVCAYLKTKHSNLTVKPLDVVITDDSKLAGTIKMEYLKVQTGPFGEQSLRLWDIDKIGAVSAVEENAPAAPVNLNEFQNQYGKEVVYKVTGKAPDNAASPSVWGSEPYSLDSNIGVAAVHAGVVQPGETKVVRMRVMESPPALNSSTANGITTTQYGKHTTGAYIFVRE